METYRGIKVLITKSDDITHYPYQLFVNRMNMGGFNTEIEARKSGTDFIDRVHFNKASVSVNKIG